MEEVDKQNIERSKWLYALVVLNSLDITLGESISSSDKLQVGDESGSGTSWGGNYPYEKNTILSWNFTWIHRTKERLFGIT